MTLQKGCDARARRMQGRRLLCAATVVLAVFAPARGTGQQAPSSHVLREGEELTYNVRYGPFDLGSVRIKTLSRSQAQASVRYECKALIDSYPKVPFVDLHAVFESILDTAFFSHRFIGKLKQDDRWDFSRYLFDYPRHLAYLEKGEHDTAVTKRDTVSVDAAFQDGLSLFFYARDQLFSGKTVDVPTMINEQKVNTRIEFLGKRDGVEIDAVDYPVDVVGFEGHAEFVGIFGLTGGFEGWFSNDEARVPIMAKMKVIIGSVTIELMQWKRQGWTPPKSKG